MDTVICPDEIQKELNVYCAKMKARELSEEEIWKDRKKNDPAAHLRGLCHAHVYTCETKRDMLFPVAWLIFPLLLALALSTFGINWPAFIAAHPWWFVSAVLPFGTVMTYGFASWFADAGAKRYAKALFNRCWECRKNYCAPYLREQEKKSELRSATVAMIIRDWDDVQRLYGLNEGMALLSLRLGWSDYSERVMVRDIFREIAKRVPGFVVDEPPGTYCLIYDPISAPKT
ncbi:MAG: hypothetical protein Q7R85_03775 [bacterium]|nr:hypothetical protein [bacterium]